MDSRAWVNVASFGRPGNEARVGGEASPPTPSLCSSTGMDSMPGDRQLAILTVDEVEEQTADAAEGGYKKGVGFTLWLRHVVLES